MSDKVRWGILSTAKIGKTCVIPAINAAHNAETLAVASSSGSPDAFAEELGIPRAYSDYDALLDDPEVDAVYIPLPNALHKEWVLKAAEKKKHVLCEKPAALTADEAAEMADACRKHGVLFMEAFMYQFHPMYKRVREILDSGEIGTVRVIRSAFSFTLDLSSNNIRLQEDLGGGSLYDVGCYCIHVTRLLTGKEPQQVSANGHMLDGTSVDLTTGAVLSFEDGVTGLLHSSFELPFRNDVEVIGSEGSLTIPYAFRPDNSPDGNGCIRIVKKDGESREETIEGDIYLEEVEHFSSCVLKGQDPVYTGEDTVKNMRVIEACLKSMQEGKSISL